jgi:hypothetical protein
MRRQDRTSISSHPLVDLGWKLLIELRTPSLCTCCRHYPGAAVGLGLLISPNRVSLSPEGSPGRPARRPFRGLLGVLSRCGLHTRAVTVFRDPLSEGFRHFVSSMPAPVASGWSGHRVGLAPTGKAPPCHGAHPKRTSVASPAGRPDMGALEPQMFPFLFSNPFALAVGLRGSRTSLEHRRQSRLSQALGSSARIEGVS